MAVLVSTPAPTQATCRYVACKPFQVPPIQQLAIPMQQPSFQAGAFTAGRSAGWGGQGSNCGWGGGGSNPFANYMRTAGAQATMPGQLVPSGAMLVQGRLQQHQNPSHSNIYKQYNNWNVCFSFGFDVEDGHTSFTCPFQKSNHQTLYMRKTHSSSLQWGMTRAQEGCTRQCSHWVGGPDGVGQRIRYQQINVTV
jgi:hypothetical protein